MKKHHSSDAICNSRADRIRDMNDSQMADFLFNIINGIDPTSMSDPFHAYCDGKNNCIDQDGNITCTADMEKSCLMRFLQSPAKEE